MMLLCDFSSTAPISKLLVRDSKTTNYRDQKYNISAPRLSSRKGKKYEVTVQRSDGRKKTVPFGDNTRDDFLVHKDEKRRENFQRRFAGIKKKDGSRASDDPFGASYYSTRYNW